ncbi:MAG TPA: rubredoxin [Solimonas sp.]|nr:rubredoxin [Solimonas sp.]
MKTWICATCGIVYDESRGWPEDGIVAGTRWQDVPDSWSCPDCGATKAEFDMRELAC